MNLLSRFKSRLLSALDTVDNGNEDDDENKTLPADPTAW